MAAVRSAVFEVRGLALAIEQKSTPHPAGPVLVSGMLCEQLARELAAGAEPGAVRVEDTSTASGAEVLVHVMAAEPSAADQALVRSADRAGVSVVLVQLWPQDDWTPPFVLTPFVVECRAGEGFPVAEIARCISEAAEHADGLARRVPVVRDVVSDRLVGTSILRSALVGALGARKGTARSLLALEQATTAARLRSLRPGARPDESRVVYGAAAGAVALSFALREIARRARRWAPAPLVNAAVAAGATWALAQGAKRFGTEGTM